LTLSQILFFDSGWSIPFWLVMILIPMFAAGYVVTAEQDQFAKQQEQEQEKRFVDFAFLDCEDRKQYLLANPDDWVKDYDAYLYRLYILECLT